LDDARATTNLFPSRWLHSKRSIRNIRSRARNPRIQRTTVAVSLVEQVHDASSNLIELIIMIALIFLVLIFLFGVLKREITRSFPFSIDYARISTGVQKLSDALFVTCLSSKHQRCPTTRTSVRLLILGRKKQAGQCRCQSVAIATTTALPSSAAGNVSLSRRYSPSENMQEPSSNLCYSRSGHTKKNPRYRSKFRETLKKEKGNERVKENSNKKPPA
jgi:hypothetical protein